MSLIDSEIVKELCGLSVGMNVVGVVVGLMLWLTGWWAHRFWIVMITTALAGIAGLISGPVQGIRPLLAGLLLAVAAGVLALALVRLAAFAAGGAATCLAVQAFAPPAWNEPLICFVLGGLAGLYWFRIWTRALTSFAGVVVMGYFGLPLADYFGKLDAVALTQQKASQLAWACGILTLVGFLLQLLLERCRARLQRWREMWKAQLNERKPRKSPERKPWWHPANYRQAG
jgi:hypothetical protein